MSSKLAPLPPSDMGSLEKDRGAREFWKNNQIIREKERPFEKCEHEFKVVFNGAQCVKCHFGLTGPLEVKNGKLFHNKKQLPL